MNSVINHIKHKLTTLIWRDDINDLINSCIIIYITGYGIFFVSTIDWVSQFIDSTWGFPVTQEESLAFSIRKNVCQQSKCVWNCKLLEHLQFLTV